MSSSPRAPASAAEAPRAGGWLYTSQAGSTSSKRRKLTPRVEDDCFPLDDEALLRVFAASLDTADLVRCAATCRRWHRLVTREAGFICGLNPPPPPSDGHLVRALAAGFFHHGHDDDEPGAPPRFLPFRSFHQPRAAVFDDPLFTNSRTIASLNGRLVLELRRPSRAAALRLVVCNPMSGDVSVLPTLSGKNKPGNYACALLTADDDVRDAAVDPPRATGPASFRMVLIYKRRGFMACRSYSSDASAWGPECKVTGAKISSRRLGEMDAGGVAVRGAVYWLSDNLVFGLRVDTLRATLESLPRKARACMQYCLCLSVPAPKRRLAVSPDGRLCAVQVGRRDDDRFAINVLRRDDRKARRRWAWVKAHDVDLEPWLPPAGDEGRRACLRAVCEKSGVVFFATGADKYGQLPDLALYAVDLETKEVRLVPAPPGRCCVRRSSWSFHAYEMDRVAYLTSLGVGERDDPM
ncbi:hypothetical protein ACP70R_017802 [Stipagrostis hirtigluma subsp. patula]